MLVRLILAPRDPTTSFLVLRHLRRRLLKKEKLAYKLKAFTFAVEITTMITKHMCTENFADIEWPELDGILVSVSKFFNLSIMNNYPSVANIIFQ